MTPSLLDASARQAQVWVAGRSDWRAAFKLGLSLTAGRARKHKRGASSQAALCSVSSRTALRMPRFEAVQPVLIASNMGH